MCGDQPKFETGGKLSVDAWSEWRARGIFLVVPWDVSGSVCAVTRTREQKAATARRFPFLIADVAADTARRRTGWTAFPFFIADVAADTRTADTFTRMRALLFWCACSVAAYQEAHEIESKNFDKVKDGVWLLKFYAPWCGHCKQMAPTYERVAEHYHRRGDDKVRVGRLDGTAHPNLAAPFNVKGYPTLVLLRDGHKIEEFKGERTFEAITAFVENESNAPPAGAPAAPRASMPARDGKRSTFRRMLTHRLTTMAQSVAELEPLQAGLLVMATVASLGVGLMLLLCATTTASPR